MLKDRRAAAMKVAERLLAAEKAIDRAIALAAEFNATMVSSREEAGLSADVGQDAFEQSASAFAALVRARTAIVETHNQLSETKIQIGLRTLSMGNLGKTLATRAHRQHLRAVG